MSKFLHQKSVITLKEIGELFNMDYTSISVETKRFEKKANDDKEISEMPKKITKKIEEGIS